MWYRYCFHCTVITALGKLKVRGLLQSAIIMNESIVRESLQRLRDQKRQNNDIIRDSQKTNANLHSNADQLSLQYDREECQRRKMQEALRLAVNELNCISDDVKNILQVTEDMKIQLDQVDQHKEDSEAHSKRQMKIWESECRELASKFQQSYTLYLNPLAVQDDQRMLEERCKKLEGAITRIDEEEQQLLSNENSTIDEVFTFLQLDPAASRVFDIFQIDDEAAFEALKAELEGLKAVERKLVSQVSK